MKDFIENVQKSIYSPEYYRDITSKPRSYSFKYFFGLVLALSLLLTALVSVPIVLKVPQFLRSGAAATIAYFPDELELRIARGIVTSNVTEPYFLPFPEILKDEKTPVSPDEHFIVIDTTADFSFENFTSRNVLMWVGKNFIAYTDDKGGVKIQKFDENVNYVMNKNTVRNFVAQLTPYFWIVPPAIFILLFIAFLAMGIAQLFYLLFAAILIYALLKYMNKGVSYWEAYRFGIHALTLPILLNGVLILFSLQLTQLPFMQTLILLAVIFVNFRDEEKVVSVPASDGAQKDSAATTPEQ